MENEVTIPYIREFLSEIMEQEDPLLREMEETARKEWIPVIQKESARLLEILCALSKPSRILEIGTAIGYSSIILAKAMGAAGVLDTVESDEKRVAQANRYIRKADLGKRIRVLTGDAAEILQCLGTPYDFIFLDAAKGQYPDFLPHCLRLLNSGGLMVTDNVLYKGMVARKGYIEHKHRTITVRLRAYIDALLREETLTTCIIPMGDGLAVSYKKKDLSNKP